MGCFFIDGTSPSLVSWRYMSYLLNLMHSESFKLFQLKLQCRINPNIRLLLS